MLKVSEILQAHGLRHTKQREALLNLLMMSDQPLSAEACYQQLNQQKQRMNLSTVYRILEQFSQNDILEKSYHSLQQGHVYTFIRGHHRHYLLCVKCHQMYPLDVCPMHDVIENIEQRYGFQVNAHQLELTGVCRSCRS